MAQTLQHRRGTTTELQNELGSNGELFVDTTKKTVVVMDGTTVGGTPLAKESAIPTKVSDLSNDSGFITSAAVFSGDYNDLTNTPTLFDGAYASLTGKPVIPSAVSQLANDSNYITISSVPTLVSQLANDADYANGSVIPTAVSQLTNDLDYANGSVIPTAVSQLTNDLGYLISVVDDPSPQLRGDLITNGFKVKTTIGNVVLEAFNAIQVNNNIVGGTNNRVWIGGGDTEGTPSITIPNETANTVLSISNQTGRDIVFSTLGGDITIDGPSGELIAGQGIDANNSGLNNVTGVFTPVDGSLYISSKNTGGSVTNVVYYYSAIMGAYQNHMGTVDFSNAFRVMGPSKSPTTSLGAAGDKTGEIGFDSNYIYYCVADHDGVTHIWRRQPWLSETW